MAGRGEGAAATAKPLSPDILDNGKPFRNRLAAGAALKKAGPGHEVAALKEGGFAIRALPKEEAAPAAAKPLSVGITPTNAEPVSVKDGVVHIGTSEAINFESGDPIKVAEGASHAQIKQALKEGGALSSRQKFFGGDKDAGSTASPAARGTGSPAAAIKSGENATSSSSLPAPEPTDPHAHLKGKNVTLTVPMEDGKTAKVTRDAHHAMTEMDQREAALKEVQERCQ